MTPFVLGKLDAGVHCFPIQILIHLVLFFCFSFAKHECFVFSLGSFF